MELRNESQYEFIDISSEEYRIYSFPGNSADIITINEPQYLAVSENGHRILDNTGASHYVPKGWILLSWKAKEGKPHFVK